MKRVTILGVMICLAGCVSKPSSAPDFRGDYIHDTHVEMVDGSGRGFAIRDGVRIGRTRTGPHGRYAKVRIQLFFRNAHQCNLGGDAEVTPTGLIYRERNEDNGELFVLAIDITGARATLRKVEGSGHWLCGMRGSWGGVFEKTGKRVEFVDG